MSKQRWTIIQPEWRYRVVSTMIPPAVIAGIRNRISLPIVAPQVHHDAGDDVSTTRLFSVDGINDSEMIFGEMRPRIPIAYLTFALYLGKTSEKTNQAISPSENRTRARAQLRMGRRVLATPEVQLQYRIAMYLLQDTFSVSQTSIEECSSSPRLQLALTSTHPDISVSSGLRDHAKKESCRNQARSGPTRNMGISLRNNRTRRQGEKQATAAGRRLMDRKIKKNAVAIFRLFTGHDCLAKHLDRIGISASPLCPLCDLEEEMDQNHLQHCPVTINLAFLSEKYWRARELITSLSEIQH
ncbi:hypothetical protein ANN_14442 [Periplaneta americana]|uniref:Reverse transcriptase zinc-binding domain-containing protein n=1 Tax=Periplaneta americana TaxID=6978 RepID=A0ABQ8SXX5_PERAM|nr:hypothetical protein ANN_14442 [Periplaneta americana]